jgi:tetratricopeptide (TPR) repeat protein
MTALEAHKLLREGDRAFNANQFARSAECYKGALHIVQNLSQDERQQTDCAALTAACNAGLSGALGALGQHVESLRHAEEALAFYDRFGHLYPMEHLNHVQCIVNQGAALANLGQPDEALVYMTRALDMLSAPVSLEARRLRSIIQHNIDAIRQQ